MEILNEQKQSKANEELIKNLTLELSILKKQRITSLESKIVDRDIKITTQRHQIQELEFLLTSFD